MATSPNYDSAPVDYAYGMIELEAQYSADGQQVSDFLIKQVQTSLPTLGGLTRDALIGKSAILALSQMQDQHEDWLALFRESMESGKTIEKEVYGWFNKRWIIVRCERVDEQKLIVVFTDTTQRRAAEADLKRFLELDLDLLVIGDVQGKIIKVNPAWERVLGFTEEELLSINYFEILHPEDHEKGKENFSRLSKGHQISHYINRIRTKDGSYRFLEWRSRMFDHLVYASARDVTDEVQRKQQRDHTTELESIILNLAMRFIHLPQDEYDSAMNDMLRIIGEYAKVDRGYIFTYDFEAATCTNTHEWCAAGVSPEIDNLQDVPLHLLPDWVASHRKGQLMHIPDVDTLDPESGLYQVLQPQGIRTLITLPLIHEANCLGFVGFDVVGQLRQWTGNEISILKMAAHIITNSWVKYQINEEMDRARQAAETMSNAKSQFLANMSHEIRTPLNAVIGFTDLLLNTTLSDTQQQYVESAHVSAHSLMDIINEVLDFSKIEAGKLELDVTETDILILVEQTADMVKHHCSKKGLELLLKLDWDLPRYIEVDKVRLKQILINLLGNAVKFTEKGEVEFEVQFLGDTDEPDTGRFRFLVRDTGIGISEEQRKKLFKAFVQAESSTSRRYGGTGLGLAISNNLLAMMNSHIELSSEPGMGSTFSFDIELPYRRGPEIRDMRLVELQKILIVDDNPNVLDILAEHMEQWQVQSLKASNGLQAMELLDQNGDIDLVIMDYHMPHLSGVDTIQMIRKQSDPRIAGLPVLLLHNSLDDIGKRETEHLNILHHVNKPVKIEHLYDILKEVQDMKEASGNGDPKVEHLPIMEGTASQEEQHSILLVEDFPMNMLLIRTLVKKFLPSARIREATNGRIALDAVKEDTPDLIFMDIQMPEMDGYEATRNIRELNLVNQPIIIALTASAIKGEREKCLSIGMDEYLTKPVQKELVAKMLDEFLDLEGSRRSEVRDRKE